MSRSILRLVLAGSISLTAGACGIVSDAPVAGQEQFMPISNNAYHVQQGPLVDRQWIDGAEVVEDRLVVRRGRRPLVTK